MKRVILIAVVSVMTLGSLTSCTPDELPQFEQSNNAIDNGDVTTVPPKKGGN